MASLPRLEPIRPPGRSNRKARAFSADICRLLSAGFSLDAIREALAEAGVVVSKSTVYREALRCRAAPPSPPPVRRLPARSASSAEPAPTSPPSSPTAVPEASTIWPKAGPPEPGGPAGLPGACPSVSGAATAAPGQGRELAAAFFSRHQANPLLRKDPT